MEDLEPGEEYEFRVCAVNENGVSEPLTSTKPIVAKFPFGNTRLKMVRFNKDVNGMICS